MRSDIHPDDLFRGLGASLLTCIPSLAISYAVYGRAKELLMQKHYPIISPVLLDVSSGRLSVTGALVCGSVSGIAASLVTFPVDIIRRRMQVQGMRLRAASVEAGVSPRSMGALAELRALLRNEGARGLYRGIVPELLKVSNCTTLTVYCSISSDFHLSTDNADGGRYLLLLRICSRGSQNKIAPVIKTYGVLVIDSSFVHL